MPSASRSSSGSGIVILLVALGINTAAVLAQQPAATTDPAVSRHPLNSGITELKLHHPRETCGRKWVKKLGALAEEEYAWMARYHHGLYEVSLEGQVLATIEILNTPNLRNCDLDRQWNTREMTIRVTYFFFDGSQKTELSYIAADPTFVNQPPKLFPLMGRALLVGIDSDGNARSRWLALEPLKTLYTEAAARQPEQHPVLASQ